jgi:hypothetical protein
MRIIRPLVGTAVAAGALVGGLALGLSLTGASAATAASSATTHTAKAVTETSAARSAGPAAPARAQAATAAPSTPAKMKGKCTHMPASTRPRPSGGGSPATTPATGS